MAHNAVVASLEVDTGGVAFGQTEIQRVALRDRLVVAAFEGELSTFAVLGRAKCIQAVPACEQIVKARLIHPAPLDKVVRIYKSGR